MNKKIIIIICCILLIIGGVFFIVNNNSETPNPEITITMEDGQQIVLELYPEIAPNTVKNFIHLTEQGFYDGLVFHRIIEGFMIQGGDPEGTGTGGPGYGIEGEFADNGFDNDLAHERGVISMARSQHPDSAGSQFFIIHQDAPHLDGSYAGFGRVIEGMDVVDELAAVPTGLQDRPQSPLVMETVEVETFNHDFGEPTKIE